jgi:UPF0755 protein
MRIVRWMMMGVLLLILGSTGYCFYAYHVPRSEAATILVIPPSTGVQAILEQLHTQGLAPPFLVTALPVLFTNDYHALKAGEYAFEAGLSPAQIIEKIIRGAVVIHKVTIPEGWNGWQVREALMKEPLLEGELPRTIPEGSVLPDTIHFARGEKRSNVLARLQQQQDALMSALWAKRDPALPIASPREAIILASIVEKETGEIDERALVAGVFVNRLRLGMKLQSDPTVVYGIELARGGTPMGRELSRNDLQTDTAYNTYTREGLPPTPICNPGRKAIEAVFNPATTDALYFVATGTGGHRFAATLKEHEKNVVQYRAALRAASSNIVPKEPLPSR